MTYRSGMLALASVLAAVLLVAPQAQAQKGPGMASGFYDSSAEVAIHGSVEGVEDSSGGAHVTLKTDKETCDVRLGPSAFLSQNNFSITKGDKLSVIGYKSNSQGAAFLVAREVIKDGQVLTLRSAQGFPAWAGQGMGQRNYRCAGSGCCRGCGGPGCGHGCGRGCR